MIQPNLFDDAALKYNADAVYHQPFSSTQQQALQALYETTAQRNRRNIGYPCNPVFDYSALLPFLHVSMNNIGDPYGDSYYSANMHSIEREVLQQFAQLVHAPDDYWGYITHGGTESNMYGLYIARELLPNGIVYYSEATHYSVVKILHVLGMRSITIRSMPNGEIDYEDLQETLQLHRDVPPILMINIGTTMTGAIDNLDKISAMLKSMAFPSHYIHCDAAFHGMILPFVKNPPPFDFSANIDSISISGHKLIGAPMPCGVVLTHRRNVSRVAHAVEYVGVMDTTISGSRNAITPLLLWYAWQRHGMEGFRTIVNKSITAADDAIKQLTDCGIRAWRNPHSPIVVFPSPSSETIRKWHLASQSGQSHIITLPHVSSELLAEFITDILKDLS